MHTPAEAGSIKFDLVPMRRAFLLLTCVVLISRVVSGQQPPADIAPVQQVVSRYCVDCHSSEEKGAGLALDALVKEDIGKHAEAWEKVVRKLRARQMPPAKNPRPDEEMYKTVLMTLEGALEPGTPVDVRRRFDYSWARGFEVAEATDTGYRIKRLSDGTVLPADFGIDEVRPHRKKQGLWWA